MSLESAFAGRYRLVRLLGHGGMAAVYLAHQEGIGGFTKKVALKIVHAHLASQERFTRFFINEARLGGYLLHPNIVQTLDFGEVGGRVFLAMEFVDGPTVQALLRVCRDQGKSIPPDVALQIVIGVCQALDFAHAAVDHQNERLNMVHRDLKPSNILVSRFGHVKLGDFGVARAECNLDRTLVAGTLKGTVRYMSPEQAWGVLELDYRADLFAVGSVLFELIAMEPLYDARTTETAVRQAQEAQVGHRLDALPDSPARSDLVAFLQRALARAPDERFQSAAEMVGHLTRIRQQLGQRVSLRDWIASVMRSSGEGTNQAVAVEAGPRAGSPKASQTPTVLLERGKSPPRPVEAFGEESRTACSSKGHEPRDREDEGRSRLEDPDCSAPDTIPTTLFSLTEGAQPRPDGETGDHVAEGAGASTVDHDGLESSAPGGTGEHEEPLLAHDTDVTVVTRGNDAQADASRPLQPGKDDEPTTPVATGSASIAEPTPPGEDVTSLGPGAPGMEPTAPGIEPTAPGMEPTGRAVETRPRPDPGPRAATEEATVDAVTMKLPSLRGAPVERENGTVPAASELAPVRKMRRRHLLLGIGALVLCGTVWVSVSVLQRQPGEGGAVDSGVQPATESLARASTQVEAGGDTAGVGASVVPEPALRSSPAVASPATPVGRGEPRGSTGTSRQMVEGGGLPRPGGATDGGKETAASPGPYGAAEKKPAGGAARHRRFGKLNAASLTASTIVLDGHALEAFPVREHPLAEGVHQLVFLGPDGQRLETRVQVEAGTLVRCWADFKTSRVTCR